ncbi:MAG: YkgJ family cysteine cluster protein [Methylococcales bacterium]|nr:YkgJ family cysteine cluster protein [Methylococcales bacterium]
MSEKPRVEEATDIQPVPIELFDELNHLINVQLNKPGTLIDHLKQTYDFLDKVNRTYVSTFTTCSKGCSHCCYMDVQLSAFEAEYICVATGIPHQPFNKLTTDHKTPCPFLSEQNACAIYEHRPLFCRTYHSLSAPELCGIKNAVFAHYGTAESDMGNIIYRSVYLWIHHHNMHQTGGNIKDIRDYFPHDPMAMRRHLSEIVKAE